MARDNAPAAPPAEKPPVSNDNGAGEAAGLAAAAEELAQAGVLVGDNGEIVGDEEGRQRAMRQRDPDGYEKAEAEKRDLVKVRVTKKGDGKISRGVHYGGIGDDHYEQGDRFDMPRVTALEAEERSFVEIVSK